MRNWGLIFLKIGLAFTLIYAGTNIFISPDNWIGFVPQFMKSFSEYGALYMHGAIDILLGLWILSGFRIFLGSLLSAVNLFLVTIFNLGAMDIIFRDVGIFFMALALCFLTYKTRS